MNFGYVSSDYYSQIIGVSIFSILENCKTENHNFYIIDDDITDKNKDVLKKIVEPKGSQIFFLKSNLFKEKINTKVKKTNFSNICYERLFWASLLPSEIDRIMILGGDTLILEDISEIYYTNLSGYICAGCFDSYSGPKKQAGCPKSTLYVNADVLILNLIEWKKSNAENKCVNIVKQCKGEFPHLDQDVLNWAFGNKVKIIPARYNVMTMILICGRYCSLLFSDTEPHYTGNELEEAKNNPAIIHFTGYRFVHRPWEQPSCHPYNNIWINYMRKAVFFDEKKLLKHKPRKKRFLKFVTSYTWLLLYKSNKIKKVLFQYDKKKLWDE